MFFVIAATILLLPIFFILLIHINSVIDLGIGITHQPVDQHLTILAGCIAASSFLIAAWTRHLKDGYKFKCVISDLNEQEITVRIINQKDKLALIKRIKLLDASKSRFADFAPEQGLMRVPAFDCGEITFKVPESVKSRDQIKKLDIWVDLLEGKSVKGKKEFI